MTKAQGIPLAVILTGANTRDVTPLVPRVEVMPSVRGKRGRPRRQSERVDGDRGDDSEPNRDTLRTHGITLGLAKPGTPHGGGLGVERYSRPP